MLEKETERLLKVVQEQTIGKGESIGVKELLAAAVPYPLKVFFRADVERVLQDEVRRTQANSRFNYQHPEVKTLQQQMSSTLILNFSFGREEFLQKLEDGVHLVMNFLLRPQWTLTNFLFNSIPSVTVDDLKSMLNYFGVYEYLKEILQRYLEEKQLQSLTMNEFQSLLWQIDAEYIKRKRASNIAHTTAPIYNFINFSPLPDAPSPLTVPILTKVLMKFFEDKRLPALCQALEQCFAQQAMQEVTEEQLTDIFEDVQRSNPDAFLIEKPFMKKPLDTELEKTPTGLSPADEPKIDSSKSMLLPDLRQLISEDDRKKFLRKIFKKNEMHYAAALNELESINSWKEASIYIDKIFIANNVDPYSVEAVRFSEIVHQRFFPRPKRR